MKDTLKIILFPILFILCVVLGVVVRNNYIDSRIKKYNEKH